jgi:phosphate uptake regulator
VDYSGVQPWNTSKTSHLELSELRAKLSRMGELVIDKLERALGCLKEHNVRDARVVTERDINVNRMDIDLEEMCVPCPASAGGRETSGS